jgi:iron complex outermembrane receptor protein
MRSKYATSVAAGKLVLLSALGAVPALPALAEEAQIIEEVIVTARKREESAQDVPIAITAITEQLEDANIRGLSDLNGFAPNVRIDEDPARANGVNISIRGVSPTRVDDNSLDAPIGVIVDGIYLGSLAGQALENFDLERVEILRGPQGTLFGRNTVGGVLNVVRSRPTGEWGARVKVGVGENNARETRMVVNAPVFGEQLAAKLFYTAIESDGYLRNTFTDRRQPEKDYENYGLSLLFNPTESFEALLTVEKFKDDSQGGANLTNFNLAAGVATAPPAGSPETNLSGGFLACTLFNNPVFAAAIPGAGVPCRTSLQEPDSISTNHENASSLATDAFTLNMTLDVSEDWSVVSVTGYRDMTEDRFLDFDGTETDLITIDRDNVYDQFSQELRLEGTWNDVAIVAGAYYWQSEFTQDWITGGTFWDAVGALSGYSLATNTWRPVSFLTGCNPGEPCAVQQAIDDGLTPIDACIAGRLGAVRCDSTLTGQPVLGVGGLGARPIQRLYETQETTATAYFLSADWAFAEKWTLSAGIRYTDEKKEFQAGQAYIGSEATQFARNFPGYADLDNDWQETSPRLGLTYQLNDDVMFYTTYSQGFHSGGFFGVNQNIADFERDQYEPEYAYSYEAGMKGQFLDNTLQLNLTAFYVDFEDKQESSVQLDPSTNTVATVFSNAATAIYSGIEAEGQYVLNEYARFFVTFGYLDAEYEDFETDINANDRVNEIEDATFLTPRNAPEYTYGVGGTFNYPLLGGQIVLNTKYSWIDEVETNLLNLTIGRLDEREDLSATLSYVYNDYSISLYGRNLTDETLEVPNLIVPLFAAGTLTDGATWGLELAASF